MVEQDAIVNLMDEIEQLKAEIRSLKDAGRVFTPGLVDADDGGFIETSLGHPVHFVRDEN